MKNNINKVLKEKFGYTSFRPGQKEAVESVLDGKNTLVMLPTGTGKSLCYQLPAYLKEGVVLVVSPLLSLMQDQVERLQIRGEKRVVALNSMTSLSERQRIFKQIKKYRFIYTSPEMLQNKNVINVLKKVNINLFVIDEAHCISHWGTDFRPDYLALASIRKQLNNPTTMALTATATKEVRDEIINFLGLEFAATKQIIQSVDRQEIKFVVENCPQKEKDRRMFYYLEKLKGPGIIYFMSKNLADTWAENLSQHHDIKAVSYHADKDMDDKIKIQQQFLENHIQVVCATSAFGMGFDKEDIRFIIHYHLPASPEMYLQEVGRASRDGEKSLAILFYSPGDEQIQKRFIERSLPTQPDLENLGKNKKTYINNDDTISKLTAFFLNTSKDIDEAWTKILKRKKIKENQLQYMLRYVLLEECKRSFLLQYFNEKIDEKQTICCNNCNLNTKHLIKEINQLQDKTLYNVNRKQNTIMPWNKILSILYNK